MIIWINGAFGSGKTQTSHELHRRIPESYIYDPENAGYYIRKNIPQQVLKDDFQDYSMWRDFNYSMLKYISSTFDGIIIVPMTVVNPDYFQEIIGRLRNDGVAVHHFTLWASRETLQKRLRSRWEGKHSWAYQQIDRCMDNLADEIFQHHLHTDSMSIQDVAEAMASALNIPLQPDNRGMMKRTWDRMMMQIKHIRFWQ